MNLKEIKIIESNKKVHYEVKFIHFTIRYSFKYMLLSFNQNNNQKRIMSLINIGGKSLVNNDYFQ